MADVVAAGLRLLENSSNSILESPRIRKQVNIASGFMKRTYDIRWHKATRPARQAIGRKVGWGRTLGNAAAIRPVQQPI